MLSKKFVNHEVVIDLMKEFIKRPSPSGNKDLGISFILAMNNRSATSSYDHYFDDLSLHVRVNQPCYGEMRKYEKTHENYSDPQPHDGYRPGDLFWQFPKGTIEGYGIRFDRFAFEKPTLEKSQGVIKFLFSNLSPYRRGFGSSRDVELIQRDGMIVGVVGTNTNVDPTVLVSLLQFISRSFLGSNMGSIWEKYKKVGMTDLEATIACMLVSSNPLTSIQFTQTYYLPIYPDVRRMMEGNPMDLTGKTWREGGDYNRKRLQDIFKNEKEDAGVPAQVIASKFPGKVAPSYEAFRDAFREVIQEFLENKEESMPTLLEAAPEPPVSGCMPLKKAKKAKEKAA